MAALLWKSCGGLLLVIVIASIIPGKIHVLSGKILRWPVLALTYLTIASELIVYIMVRLFIRAAEAIFSTPKHRALRNSLDEATTYKEWLSIAKKLDYSKGRDRWQQATDDDTSYKYNWTFINELIIDMRQARREKDVMLAMVVLQQCTRKNVGGIMNEDLFSFTNTGEPKTIVKDFLNEVTKTLEWVTKHSSNRRESYSKTRDIDIPVVTEEKIADEKVEKERNIVEQAIHHSIVWPLNQVIGPVQWAVEVATGKHKDSAKNVSRSISLEPARVEEENSVLLKEQLAEQQREQVKTFLKRARAAYGRTALCLSGGGAMGW